MGRGGSGGGDDTTRGVSGGNDDEAGHAPTAQPPPIKKSLLVADGIVAGGVGLAVMRSLPLDLTRIERGGRESESESERQRERSILAVTRGPQRCRDRWRVARPGRWLVGVGGVGGACLTEMPITGE